MIKYDRMKVINELNQELEEAGVPRVYCKIDGKLLEPINVLINGGISAKPYIDILLKYGALLEQDDKSMIARALTEKGLKEAVPFLLSIFEEGKIDNKMHLWAVGNALNVINDRASYPAILNICRETRFGMARQMLMDLLARMKTTEAYEVLIECLSDETVKAHAISALGKFGNTKAIEVLKSLSVSKGKYEFKAKEKAIKKLEKKLEAGNYA